MLPVELDAFAPAPRRAQTASRAPRTPRAVERWPHKVVGVACWIYLVGALSLWLFLRSEGDYRWIATLILFGPRWVALAPVAVLLPAALLLRRRSLFALCAASALIVAPVMGLCVPWRNAFTPAPATGTAQGLRVLTCNIHRYDLDPVAFAALIASAKPDIVAIQDWSSKFDSIFPSAGGWYMLRDDDLCLISRYPIRRVRDVGVESWNKRQTPGSAICYELAMPQGPVPFVNLHLASPHRAFEAALQRSPDGPKQIADNSAARLKQSQAVGRFVREQSQAVLVAGDFNTPQESGVFTRSWTPLVDAYGAAGLGWGYTYHARWTDVRIDHILSGRAWRCRKCEVGPDVGSPHRPVIADFEWVGAAVR
ncbi:MAG: hypothetical protein JWN40_4296 [Phycisphaerales bacterium]|nr:hypothetical protein [Phycisphaerales bacterium]